MYRPTRSLPIALFLLFTLSLPAVAHEDHQETTFEVATEHYLFIQTALVGDTDEGVAKRAAAIAEAIAELVADFDAHKAGVAEEDIAACRLLLPELATAATRLSITKNLKTARAAFGDLSTSMVQYRDLVSGDEKPHVAYCPMAKQKWLQNGKKIANPYYGSSMLRCGSIVED